MSNLCTVVVCGAPLASRANDLAAALVAASWSVKVVLTPAAGTWVDRDSLLTTTGEAVRTDQRAPTAPKDRRRPSAVVIAPITFNTVGKLAHGIADTLAHSTLCEAMGESIPILAVPMVNDRLWGHIAWSANVDRLTSVGFRWLNIHDGSIGPPQMVESGTGEEAVCHFQPSWVVDHLSVLKT